MSASTSSATLHNKSGVLTGFGSQTYMYEGEDRLAQAVLGATWQYNYDAANRRVKKIAGSATTNYVWEGKRVIAEYNGVTGALLAEYVYAGDRLLAREAAGAVTYYHQDRLSVRLLTDSAGNWAGTQSHEPFGEQVEERDLVSKWRFTNYERDDESSGDYAVNRQYLTHTGRFMRPDPVGGDIADPQSFNRYAYVANDPVNAADPLGLLVCFLTYEYQYFTTTVDGEDAVGIRVAAMQHCYDIGGGGARSPGSVSWVDGGSGGGRRRRRRRS